MSIEIVTHIEKQAAADLKAVLFQHFGFTPENVAQTVQAVLRAR